MKWLALLLVSLAAHASAGVLIEFPTPGAIRFTGVPFPVASNQTPVRDVEVSIERIPNGTPITCPSNAQGSFVVATCPGLAPGTYFLKVQGQNPNESDVDTRVIHVKSESRQVRRDRALVERLYFKMNQIGNR